MTHKTRLNKFCVNCFTFNFGDKHLQEIEFHEDCTIEKQEAVRCLSAVICRYTNRHSSELSRPLKCSEAVATADATDELLDRVSSRASKVSAGQRSSSRCGSRCSRETCRRRTKTDDVKLASNYSSSPASSSSLQTHSKQPGLMFVSDFDNSAFKAVASVTSSSSCQTKNRMADFWEKSVQAANQVENLGFLNQLTPASFCLLSVFSKKQYNFLTN